MRKNLFGLMLVGIMLLTIAAGCLTNTETITQTTTVTETATQTAVGQPMGPPENAGAGGGMVTTPTGYQAVADLVNSYPVEELTQEEIDGILWMREEEKLARDVYLTLYEKWGLPIFYNIATRSEQTHMDMVLALIEKYNLTDPVGDNGIGEFTNPEIQALYDKLVAEGSKSVKDALKVGALIEEVDIKDLEEWLAKSDNEDIKFVYENLMMGSRNHLRAFVRNLENYGITYQPQVLPQDQYEQIISTPMETGYGG
ncbi:DUF2202 domain-containing protein [Thermococcus paralvinellae]|uniref:DUF2202 domain-containing protein n=1 Tax=Thermococcus paralvinellae TaxID=582419 RepID=W0I3Q6_9EURY|nr:DUF2202 domain-containing protein [Thermococcus paralvinellae]AHF80669.1 Hypothetical protein TES1_1289 [Thermococcus paralvinellae]